MLVVWGENEEEEEEMEVDGSLLVEDVLAVLESMPGSNFGGLYLGSLELKSHAKLTMNQLRELHTSGQSNASSSSSRLVLTRQCAGGKRAKTEVVVDLSLDDEEEEEEVAVEHETNPPLFYQNWFKQLGRGMTPQEQRCSRNVWELVEDNCDALQECYVMTYVADLQVMRAVFPAKMFDVPVTLVSGDRGFNSPDAQNDFHTLFSSPMSRLIVPEMPTRFGTYHTKMLVLFYAKGVRVIVHTANLEASNLFMHAEGSWCQDFPLKSSTAAGAGASSSSSSSEFERELGRILVSSGIREARAVISRFDFALAEVALVASIPRATAYATPQERSESGLGRVAHLLQKEREMDGGEGIRDWPITVQSSSLGTMTTAVKQREGGSSSSWFVDELGAAMGAQSPAQMRLVVVSKHDVFRGNVFGPNAALATFHNKEHFANPALRQALCTWTPSNPQLPTRALVLPHIKTYVCSSPTDSGSGDVAWLILGSHNCTKAAWGYATAAGKMTCLSHEVSVMFLPSYMRNAGRRRFNAGTGEWHAVSPLRDRFTTTPTNSLRHGFLPVPYRLPATRYGSSSTSTPFARDDDDDDDDV